MPPSNQNPDGGKPKDDDVDDDDIDNDDDLDDDDDDKGLSDKAKAAIAKRERENAKARQKLRDARKREESLQQELDKLKNKGDSDDGKAARELKEAQDRADKADARYRKSALRSEAIEQASKLGFRSPALAARLIDADDIEFDDDGEPDGRSVKQALREILREDPTLKRGARDDEDEEDDDDADAGRGRRGGGKSGGNVTNMSSMIRRAAGH